MLNFAAACFFCCTCVPVPCDAFGNLGLKVKEDCSQFSDDQKGLSAAYGGYTCVAVKEANGCYEQKYKSVVDKYCKKTCVNLENCRPTGAPTAPAGPCASLPCLNGGQCTDKIESPGGSMPIGSRRREQSTDKDFTCHCKGGFTGLTCEVVFGGGGSRVCPTASFEVSEQACRVLGRIEFPMDDEDGNDVFGDIQAATIFLTRRVIRRSKSARAGVCSMMTSKS